MSSDNDPLFEFHRWKANLRILEVDEIKSQPRNPNSHPFIERLILSCRSEVTDQTLFWNERDLQNKLDAYKEYFNTHRGHMSLTSKTPNQIKFSTENRGIVHDISDVKWNSYCRGLFKLPTAA